MFWCVPWYTPHLQIIKLKSFRSLIQHYLGNFFEKLTLDQLSVNLYGGTGTVCDVTLNCDELNKYGGKEKWPVELIKGRMEDITVSVPWTRVFKGDSIFKINGLSITVQPKNHDEPVTSVLAWIFSMLSSWSKWSMLSKYFLMRDKQLESLQIAHTEPEEHFSAIIDSSAVLRCCACVRCSRMCYYLIKGFCWVTFMKHLKVKLENTKIRIKHAPENIDQGAALEIHIENIDYYDDETSEQTTVERDADKLKYFLNIYTDKRIRFDGVTLFRVAPDKDESLMIPNAPKCRRSETYNKSIANEHTPDSVVCGPTAVIRDVASKALKAITVTESSGENIPSKKINLKMQYCLP